MYIEPDLACGGIGKKGILRKEKIEIQDRFLISASDNLLKVDFEVISRAGRRPEVEKPPKLAVGKYGPVYLSVRVIIDRIEILYGLSSWVAAVENIFLVGVVQTPS